MSAVQRLEVLQKGLGIPLVLLNLDRRQDRLHYVTKGIPTSSEVHLLRFRAYDGLNPLDLEELENKFQRTFQDFPLSRGNFCNRYSQLSILMECIEQGWPVFAVAEDDVCIRGCQGHLSFAKSSLKIYGSDIFFLCGWDYLPKESAFGRLCRVKRARCTLGTAFSVYSIEGASRLLKIADRYHQMPLDQAVAQLTSDGDLQCIGYRFNPYSQNTDLGTDVQTLPEAPSAAPLSALRQLKTSLNHTWQICRNNLGL